MSANRLRPEQEAIVDYRGGKVGVAAVPGSGKTFTLAHLAARLIARGVLADDQEVLIVTFTNSAVNTFTRRIGRLLEEQYGLLPSLGYRVRTLHGLAHDIVRERPALVGLTDDFAILDERSALDAQRDIVAQLLPGWWDRLSGYFDPEIEPKQVRYRFEQDAPNLVVNFIKRAKDLRLEPYHLLDVLADLGDEFALAHFAARAYADYQRSLAYRGAVDFDDLVRYALEALTVDEQYLERLRRRWPYVLEDEAQDSSALQEQMLRALSANRNWVRVGDPNQAINTTFTTADPHFLIRFLEDDSVAERPLSVSGRSTASIIALANELVRWTVEEHPSRNLRDSFDYRYDDARGRQRGVIVEAPDDDPQPNPSDRESFLHLRYKLEPKITPDKELELITSAEELSLIPWLEELRAAQREDPLPTVAVLVPENSRGFKLAEMLRRAGIQYEELLRSTSGTRQAVSLLHTLLEYLNDPADLKRLKQVFWALMPDVQRALVQEDLSLRQTITQVFARWKHLEDFLWPASAGELDLGDLPEAHTWLREEIAGFRRRVQRWLKAVTLPVDQLVLTVAQDVFREPVDVALAHKVAVLLRGMAQTHPDWRLPEFIEELRAISNNERRFIGFDDAQEGYEPKPGVVTIATMHAAKGLEWDRVYLMAVSNYAFPSALPYDAYIGEKWYVRGTPDGELPHLNLDAEALAQLDAIYKGTFNEYSEGEATRRARVDYARERLRLLYVGITRARKELIITWNSGRFFHRGKEFENQPAQPLVALGEYARRELLAARESEA